MFGVLEEVILFVYVLRMSNLCVRTVGSATKRADQVGGDFGAWEAALQDLWGALDVGETRCARPLLNAPSEFSCARMVTLIDSPHNVVIRK